jgi:hypothetical protein
MNPHPLALTAMEFLMQEAAVFLGIKERLQEAPFMP